MSETEVIAAQPHGTVAETNQFYPWYRLTRRQQNTLTGWRKYRLRKLKKRFSYWERVYWDIAFSFFRLSRRWRQTHLAATSLPGTILGTAADPEPEGIGLLVWFREQFELLEDAIHIRRDVKGARRMFKRAREIISDIREHMDDAKDQMDSAWQAYLQDPAYGTDLDHGLPTFVSGLPVDPRFGMKFAEIRRWISILPEAKHRFKIGSSSMQQELTDALGPNAEEEERFVDIESLQDSMTTPTTSTLTTATGSAEEASVATADPYGPPVPAAEPR